MALDKDTMLMTALMLIGVLFLLFALPIKNWLELRKIKTKIVFWNAWLSEKPSKEAYSRLHSQGFNQPICDYCGNNRHMPLLEMALPLEVKFGVINNSFKGESNYKSFKCSGCGSELYRDYYEVE